MQTSYSRNGFFGLCAAACLAASGCGAFTPPAKSAGATPLPRVSPLAEDEQARQSLESERDTFLTSAQKAAAENGRLKGQIEGLQRQVATLKSENEQLRNGWLGGNTLRSGSGSGSTGSAGSGGYSNGAVGGKQSVEVDVDASFAENRTELNVNAR